MTTRASTAIVYPETDSMPLPDGEYQSSLFRRIVGDLKEYFSDGPSLPTATWSSACRRLP